MKLIAASTLVLTTFVVGAISIACTTTTTTTTQPAPADTTAEKQPTDPAGGDDGKDDDKAANPPTSSSGGTSGGTSSGGTPAAGECGGSATQQACVQCCAQKYQSGAAVYMGALTECLCAADKCKTECGATVCAETQQNPDAACNTCINSKSQACASAVTTACGASPDCVKFNNCAGESKCETKK